MRKILLTLTILMITAAASASDKQFTLVIDAGHGGHDPGAMSATSKEKDINLNVALAFGRLVEKNCKGVNVVYTRKTDVFIELNERANIANRNKANLFISIHTNSLPKGHIASGFETYTLGMARANENLDVAKRENSVITYEKNYKEKYEGFNPNSAESYIMFEFMQDKNMAQSVELAKEIQNSTCRLTGRNDKGVHQAGFLVLRKTSMPSCLIELGFISTPEEEQYLTSEEGVANLAQGIFNAFVKYRNKYDKNIVVPYQVQEESVVQYPKSSRNDAPETTHKAEQKPAPKQPEPVEQPVQAPQEMSEKSLSSIYSGRDGIFYRVQLFATRRILRPGSTQFQGEEDIDYYQEDGFFKYTKGEAQTYKDISPVLKKLKSKFPEAYIIAIKNGKKISVADAKRETN